MLLLFFFFFKQYIFGGKSILHHVGENLEGKKNVI